MALPGALHASPGAANEPCGAVVTAPEDRAAPVITTPGELADALTRRFVANAAVGDDAANDALVEAITRRQREIRTTLGAGDDPIPAPRVSHLYWDAERELLVLPTETGEVTVGTHVEWEPQQATLDLPVISRAGVTVCGELLGVGQLDLLVQALGAQRAALVRLWDVYG